MSRRTGAAVLRSVAAGCALLALLSAVLCPAETARAATAVRIAGNVALRERDLREAAAAELADLDDPSRRAAAAADAAFQMERAGRRAGYALIEVEYALSGEGEEVAAVFTIREGPLVRLGQVSFSGNAFFPVGRLRPLVAAEGAAPYVEADVLDGRKAIVQLYRDEGFPDVKVGDPRIELRPEDGIADVRFEIAEGVRYSIRGIVFEGDALPGADAALRKLVSGLTGQPWYERRKATLVSGVTELFASRGYPDATVTAREEPGESPGDVVLRVAVASGPRVRVSRVEVAGNARTRASFIRSKVPLRPGDWYDGEKVHEASRELYRTGVFKRVTPSLEGGGGERVLRFEVEEAPAREVSGEVGWGSYERLRGRAEFRNRNVFGAGRSTIVAAAASTKSRSLETNFLDPRFLGSELSLSVPLTWRYREEPTYDEEEVELSARLYRLFPGRVSAGVKYGFNFDHISSLSPDVPPDARDEEHTTASVKANVEIDRRDNIFYPKRGWLASGAVEIADQRLGGSLDFLRCTAAAKLFQPLGAGFVLGVRLDSGFIVPTRGTAEIPVNERFYAGGESSVRSFKEQQLGPKGPDGDPLGGLASTVASLELRRRVVGNLAASVFADLGNVSPNQSLASLDQRTTDTADYVASMWKDYFKDFRAGVGFGLQYLTPVGPVRLDLAWNPAPRESEHEAAFVSHFSIGMAF